MPSESAKEIQVTPTTKAKLRNLLAAQSPVLRFADEPALASLCACIGLQFEVGNPEYDRLTPFFGLSIGTDSPWRSQIFSQEGEFRICFTPRQGGSLDLRHSDFGDVLHPSSLDRSGELSRVVIAPAEVARRYSRRGFDLVIVRDWILASSLAPELGRRVSYLLANEWEIQSNIALRQADLMAKQQLAFFGTHDVVDHLLGANRVGFDKSRSIVETTREVLEKTIPAQGAPYEKLIQAYFVGVALDDLAQPKWYGSSDHIRGISETLQKLQTCPATDTTPVPLPPEFHARVAELRQSRASA